MRLDALGDVDVVADDLLAVRDDVPVALDVVEGQEVVAVDDGDLESVGADDLYRLDCLAVLA